MKKQLLLFSIFFIFLTATASVSAFQLNPSEQHFVDTVQYAQLHNLSINVSRYAHERNINLSLILPYITNLSHPHAPTTHAPTANTTNTTTIHTTNNSTNTTTNLNTYTALHIITRNKASAVDLALDRKNNAITYTYLRFYMYSLHPDTSYTISIDRTGTGNFTTYKGTINKFSALKLVDLNTAYYVKEIRVTIGTDIYTFYNIKLLHKAITKSAVAKSQGKVSITAFEYLKQKAQIFIAVLLGSMLAMLAAYVLIKHRKENAIEEML